MSATHYSLSLYEKLVATGAIGVDGGDVDEDGGCGSWEGFDFDLEGVGGVPGWFVDF
jgi:hypothetical protein